MGAAREMNPAKNLLQVGGVPIRGFGESSSFKLRKNAAYYRHKTGVDGEVTRVKVLDRSWMLEITLMSSSASNQHLDALAASDAYTFVNFEDLNGLTLFAGEQAWIEEAPELDYGADVTERVWKLFIADGKSVITGT